MKPAPFDYHRPDSVAAAAEMLAEFGEESKVLAGGQSLVPMLALRLAFFDHLIDISRLDELKGIERQNGAVWIGAGTTDAAVGADDEIRAAVPLLTRVTPFVGHFQIRSRGTFGGSIAHADPAGEYPAVALALDAEMEACPRRGQRQIPAAEFFTGLWETALEHDEVLTGVRLPRLDGPVRLRGAGIRPSPWRFRDRGHGDGRRTRRRPGVPMRNRPAGPGIHAEARA